MALHAFTTAANVGVSVCLFERRDWTTENSEKGLTVMEDIPDEFLRKVLSSSSVNPQPHTPKYLPRWGTYFLLR